MHDRLEQEEGLGTVDRGRTQRHKTHPMQNAPAVLLSASRWRIQIKQQMTM